MVRDEEIETAKVSVERLQSYDTKALGRTEDFGKAMLADKRNSNGAA